MNPPDQVAEHGLEKGPGEERPHGVVDGHGAGDVIVGLAEDLRDFVVVEEVAAHGEEGFQVGAQVEETQHHQENHYGQILDRCKNSKGILQRFLSTQMKKKWKRKKMKKKKETKTQVLNEKNPEKMETIAVKKDTCKNFLAQTRDTVMAHTPDTHFFDWLFDWLE